MNELNNEQTLKKKKIKILYFSCLYNSNLKWIDKIICSSFFECQITQEFCDEYLQFLFLPLQRVQLKRKEAISQDWLWGALCWCLEGRQMCNKEWVSIRTWWTLSLSLKMAPTIWGSLLFLVVQGESPQLVYKSECSFQSGIRFLSPEKNYK